MISRDSNELASFYFQNKPSGWLCFSGGDNGLIAAALAESVVVVPQPESEVDNDHYSTNSIRKSFHFHAIEIIIVFIVLISRSFRTETTSTSMMYFNVSHCSSRVGSLRRLGVALNH
jgi:hypothetical protein